MIKGLSSNPQPVPPRPDRTPAVSATAPREAAHGVMSSDALVSKAVGASRLENRALLANVYDSDFLGILSHGAVAPDLANLSIDKVDFSLNRVQVGGPKTFVLQLSEAGKKALLEQTPGLAESLGNGTADQIVAKAPLKLDTDIEEILLSPEDRAAMLKAYGERVARGEAPETIAGKPFQTFFDQHVRGTEDVAAEVELKTFRKIIPGFADLSPTEQRVRAALGGAMADRLPSSIPGDVRRQMTNSMIRHKTFHRPDPGKGLQTAGELKDFFHGTTMGGLVSRIGFRAQPEMLFNELPKGLQTLLSKKHQVQFRSMLGPGVYFGNATVASGYAGAKNVWEKPVQVVSGRVALGHTNLKGLDKAEQAHTIIAPTAAPEGAYYVTRDPRRFTVKAVTTFDPKQTDGLMRFFPQLLKAYPDNSSQIAALVDNLPSAPSQRALEEALKGDDALTRKSATLLLAHRGNQAALASALKMLDSPEALQDPMLWTTMMDLVRKTGPGKIERQASIVEAFLKASEGSESARRMALEDLSRTMGSDLAPILKRFGLTPEEVMKRYSLELTAGSANKPWLERATKLASKGLKHLF